MDSETLMAHQIVWFRNNLRVRDNEPLTYGAEAAKKAGGLVVPIYVLDPHWFGTTSFGFDRMGRFRRKFLMECLQDLDQSLRKLGSRLWIFEGRTEEVLASIAEQIGAGGMVAATEFAPEEQAVVRRLLSELRESGVATRLFDANTLVSQEQLPFDIHAVPDTFSRFRREVETELDVPALAREPFELRSDRQLSERLRDIGAVEDLRATEAFRQVDYEADARACLEFRGGETPAWKRVEDYFWRKDRLGVYKNTRNGMLGGDDSSKFSPWLAHGCLSPRQIYHEVKRYEAERGANDSTYWLVFELLWRDYFAFIVARYGADVFRLGGLRKQPLPWNQDAQAFESWRLGETGFPLIDANMRELANSGFMSNRGRQNVASFLTKNLGVDWRMGAEWFEALLVDYDPCSNYGNWNYLAGVGNDARGFRWFNTLKQSHDYDPDGSYVRHWLPCLRRVPDEFVHEPWKMSVPQQAESGCTLKADYPLPVVDLYQSAERHEQLYRDALKRQ